VLKGKVLSAVAKAKAAVQDLAFEGTLVTRGAAVHTPGSEPTYPEVSTPVSIVESKFETKELEDQRILASDRKWLVFPTATGGVPKPNDMIYVGTRQYRVINNDKVMAGYEVALSQLQIRALG